MPKEARRAPAALSELNWLHPPREDDGSGTKDGRPYQATDECFHGLVAGPEAKDGPGEPEDAQLGNLKATRGRLEIALRPG